MSLVRFRSEAPKTEVLKKSSAYAAVAHLVERHLAKVEVASSSLVGRSIGSEISLPSWWRGQVVRQRSAKPLFTSSNLVATSKTALDFGPGLFCFYLCKHKTRPGMLSTSPVLFIPRYNSSCPFPSSDPMPCPPVSVHRPASPLLLPGSAPPKYWSAAGPALHRLPHISQPIYHRNGYNFTCAVSFVATTPPTCYNGSITP